MYLQLTIPKNTQWHKNTTKTRNILDRKTSQSCWAEKFLIPILFWIQDFWYLGYTPPLQQFNLNPFITC